MFTLFLLQQPRPLYIATVLCFVFSLLLLEGMKSAEKKSCRVTYVLCAVLSIIVGIVGWVGFFLTLISYTNAGLHP